MLFDSYQYSGKSKLKDTVVIPIHRGTKINPSLAYVGNPSWSGNEQMTEVGPSHLGRTRSLLRMGE